MATKDIEMNYEKVEGGEKAVDEERDGTIVKHHPSQDPLSKDLSGEKSAEDAEVSHLKSLLSSFLRLWNLIKYIGSGILLAYSVAIIMTGNGTDKPVKGAGAIVVFWIFIVYLAILEGGQNALVGLQSVDPDTYKENHKITYLSTELTRRPGYLEKFIMGRQLLTVIVVFVINMVGSIHAGCSTSFNTSDVISAIFCQSGIALIVSTISLGQVSSQIITSICMLDFNNNYIFALTAYLSVAIEFSGVLHFVHFVARIFESFSDVKKEIEETLLEKVLFWGRVAVSGLFLGFSLAVIIQEILKGHSQMWGGVPPGVTILIFFILLCIVGTMEGLQIALFAVVKMSWANDKEDPAAKEMQHKYRFAMSCCELAFRGKNLKRFVVGRQIFVTVCMFVVARISAVDAQNEDIKDGGYTSFGISDSFMNFVNTGMLGAFVTTIIGSLIWRVIASKAPLVFLNNPLIYYVIHACLIFEATGVLIFSRAVAKVVYFVMGFKADHEHDEIDMEVDPDKSDVDEAYNTVFMSHNQCGKYACKLHLTAAK